MGSGLHPGAHLHPQPLFPSAHTGKGSSEGPGANTPTAPLCWGLSRPGPLGRCGCSPQPWAARGGSRTRDLAQSPPLSFFLHKNAPESFSVPGSQPSCPPALPSCMTCPFTTPALATSIHGPPLATSVHGHQYSQSPRSPGQGCEGVGCPLRSFPGSAGAELVPGRAIRWRTALALPSLPRGPGCGEAFPESEAQGVASPGTTGSSFLPCPLPAPAPALAAEQLP